MWTRLICNCNKSTCNGLCGLFWKSPWLCFKRLNHVDWILNQTFGRLFAVTVSFSLVRYSVTSSSICHYICLDKLEHFRAKTRKQVGRRQLENGSRNRNNIVSMTMLRHVNSVRKAGFRIYKSLSLWTRKSILCVSVISGLFFKEMYGLFVGTNKLSVITGCPY